LTDIAPAHSIHTMNLSKESDEKLVQLYQSGDKEVFEEILNRYESKIYNFGVKMCRQAEDAKDLLQDTFLNVFRYLDTFRGETRFKNWLYRIASTACLKKQRKRKHQPDVELSWEELLPGDHPSSEEKPGWLSTPAEQLMNKELTEFITNSLQELPPKYRQVFLLRDMEEFNTSEVAQILGISEASVKTRLHRARIFLRNKIQEQFGGPHSGS